MSHFMIVARRLVALSFIVAILTVATTARAQLTTNEQQMQSSADCGWAGVHVSPMTTPFADSLGFTESYGAIFDQPQQAGPAANAGIEAGDILTTINGVPLEKSSDFNGIIAAQAPGSTVYLNTWRDGQLMGRKLVLGASACPVQASGNPPPTSHPATRLSATQKTATTFNTSQLGQRGPVLLQDILRLIGQSTKLQNEVNSVLTVLNKIADEVTCIGDQFPGQWNNLAGITVAPYACDFTDKSLLIDATIAVTGPNGKIYDSITPAAMENADAVVQRNPIWVWRAKK
jgi:hypothetical protein